MNDETAACEIPKAGPGYQTALSFIHLKGSRHPAFADVEEECREQEEQWGGNGDRAKQPPALWLSVLVEEVGEASKEVCEGWDDSDHVLKHQPALRRELVQVAAVAISWIEAIDASVGNCDRCCYYEKAPEDRECPPNCPVLCAKRAQESI